MDQIGDIVDIGEEGSEETGKIITEIRLLTYSKTIKLIKKPIKLLTIETEVGLELGTEEPTEIIE